MRAWETYRQQLMRAARSCPVSDAIPAGFERRVLNRLRHFEARPVAVWGWWQALVRAAWACAGLALVISGVAWGWGSASAAAPWEPDLESTLLVVLEEAEGWR